MTENTAAGSLATAGGHRWPASEGPRRKASVGVIVRYVAEILLASRTFVTFDPQCLTRTGKT